MIDFLEANAIDYMVTGSVVSSLQGEPRASHDVDLVVDLPTAAIPQLLAAFSTERFYLSETAVRDAVRQRRMFNLLDTISGDKVDFWLLTDSAFDRSRFSRRCREPVFGQATWITAPEDTILAKLRWARESGGSEKQFNDALRIYEVQCPHLDQGYLDDWAQRLHVLDEWQRLQSLAESSDE